MAGSVFWTPLVKTNYKDSKDTEEKAFPLFRFTQTPIWMWDEALSAASSTKLGLQ